MTEQTQVTRGWFDEVIVPTYSPGFRSGAWSGFPFVGSTGSRVYRSGWRYRGKRAGSLSSGFGQNPDRARPTSVACQ